MIKRLTIIKETIDLHSCGISQYILDHYLEELNSYDTHLASLRGAYKAKMQVFTKALQKNLKEFQFEAPKGGMFIFGSLPGVDTFALVQKCIKEKVVYVPANQFYLDKPVSDEIRFNFTYTAQHEVEEGLQRINKALKA